MKNLQVLLLMTIFLNSCSDPTKEDSNKSSFWGIRKFVDDSLPITLEVKDEFLIAHYMNYSKKYLLDISDENAIIFDENKEISLKRLRYDDSFLYLETSFGELSYSTLNKDSYEEAKFINLKSSYFTAGQWELYENEDQPLEILEFMNYDFVVRTTFLSDINHSRFTQKWDILVAGGVCFLRFNNIIPTLIMITKIGKEGVNGILLGVKDNLNVLLIKKENEMYLNNISTKLSGDWKYLNDTTNKKSIEFTFDDETSGLFTHYIDFSNFDFEAGSFWTNSTQEYIYLSKFNGKEHELLEFELVSSEFLKLKTPEGSIIELSHN
ncbi:MAG: hypothetical protein WBA74_19295 [Cyclobacteriaceae bacterium]